LKLNFKNILVNLKYLNLIKFQYGRLDQIQSHLWRHKLCWIRQRSTWLTDPTQLNFT